MEKNLLNSILDIYNLKKEDIASLKKNGEKFASNLINAINVSKNNSLDKLISALGIRHVGTKSAKILAKNYKTMENIMSASEINLASLEDIGTVTAKNVHEFFNQEQTKDLIEKLRNVGINMSMEEDQEQDNRFQGMTFVLTGSLEKYTREEASEVIEKFGGKTANAVSKKTSYVLAGESSGSKLTKAQELGIKVITEDEFEKMIID